MCRYILPLLILAATSSASAQTSSTDGREMVFIEHAEIVKGTDGGPDFAYLAIWNGSGSPLVISKISASGYADIQVARAKSETISRTSVEASVLTIPSRSEIVMSPSTVFLAMTPPKKHLLPVQINVNFETGRKISATATDKPSPSELVHHDHGVAE